MTIGKNYRFHTIIKKLLFTGMLFIIAQISFAEDSVTVKKVKRYIRPCLYINHYSTPQRRVEPSKQYTFAQNNLGYYMPLYTNTWFNKDSISLSSFHVIMTTDLMRYKPSIAFLNEKYEIGRLSAGVRIFYSNGNRSVFYFSVAPFVSQEWTLFGRRPIRVPMAFIYSRTVSKKFSYRLGVARSYTFGRVLPIPIIGFRFGPIDNLHVSIQFPRNIAFNFPMGKSSWASVFTRSMGGIYNVETQDTIITDAGEKAQLRRYELLHGMQFSFRTGKNVSFYFSTGFTSSRRITYVFEDETTKSGYNFNKQTIAPSMFFSMGISFRFGKAKKVYNNTLMYDVLDLNTLKNTGLSETGPVDNDVPADPNRSKIDDAKKIKYKDVEDLIIDEY